MAIDPGLGGDRYYKALYDALVVGVQKGQLSTPEWVQMAVEFHVTLQQSMAPIFGKIGDMTLDGFWDWMRTHTTGHDAWIPTGEKAATVRRFGSWPPKSGLTET
jgi:hypothetical protein